jgi:hypothetical protein
LLRASAVERAVRRQTPLPSVSQSRRVRCAGRLFDQSRCESESGKTFELDRDVTRIKFDFVANAPELMRGD